MRFTKGLSLHTNSAPAAGVAPPEFVDIKNTELKDQVTLFISNNSSYFVSY